MCYVAFTLARRSDELSPDNGGLLNTLGVALYRAEQWQEAIDAGEEAIKLGFDVPHNWLFIAMSHWHLNHKAKAKEWYDKALAWQTPNPDAANADAERNRFFAEAAELIGATATESGQTAQDP